MKLIAAIAALLAGVVVIGTAPATRPRVVAEPETHVADMLAGRWVSTEYGWAESVWMPPRDGRMLGVFRWHNDEGGVIVHELLSIATEGDQTVLLMRHFDESLGVWAQERDGPIRFVLAEATARRLLWKTESADAPVERYEQELVEMEGGTDLLRSRVHFAEASGQETLELTMRPMGLAE